MQPVLQILCLTFSDFVCRSPKIRQLQEDKSDLERQVTELSSKCEQIKPREAERYEGLLFLDALGRLNGEDLTDWRSLTRMPTKRSVYREFAAAATHYQRRRFFSSEGYDSIFYRVTMGDSRGTSFTPPPPRCPCCFSNKTSAGSLGRSFARSAHQSDAPPTRKGTTPRLTSSSAPTSSSRRRSSRCSRLPKSSAVSRTKRKH